jgi:hypothetical protein
MAVEAIELLDPLIERAARTDIRGDLLPSVAEFGDALARLRRDHAVTRPPLNSTDTTVR